MLNARWRANQTLATSECRETERKIEPDAQHGELVERRQPREHELERPGDGECRRMPFGIVGAVLQRKERRR